MAAQKENGRLRAQVSALEQELAELKLSIARPHRVPTTASTTSALASVKLATSISRIAKFGQLFYAPCIPEESFRRERPDFEHDHPDRYLEQNLDLGFIADLYHLYPYSYHESIALSDTFKSVVSLIEFFLIYCAQYSRYFKFSKAKGKGISNAIERFRRHAGEIFGLGPDVFRKANYPRSTIPKLRQLLGTSVANGRDTYPLFPPVLFPDGRSDTMSHIFLNPLLFKVGDFDMLFLGIDS